MSQVTVNVAAVEVEEALVRHPAVKSAQVVGVPHPTRGENVAAFVIAEPGARAHEVRDRHADFEGVLPGRANLPAHVDHLGRRARDRLLPQRVSTVHPRFGTPYVTTIITGCVVALFAGLLRIDVVGGLGRSSYLPLSCSACLAAMYSASFSSNSPSEEPGFIS